MQKYNTATLSMNNAKNLIQGATGRKYSKKGLANAGGKLNDDGGKERRKVRQRSSSEWALSAGKCKKRNQPELSCD
jgi:hypothetical protein